MAETNTKPAKEVRSIKMTDGRIVDFVGNKKLIKESYVDDAIRQAIEAAVSDTGINVRLDFSNGQTRTWHIPVFHLLKCAAHGAEQKLGDEIAGVGDVDDAVEAEDALLLRLNESADGWTTRKEGMGFAGTSVLVQAICEVSGKSAEVIRGFLKDKTQIEKNALADGAKYGAIVKRIKEERAAKREKIDTSGLESEIDALPAAA